MLAEKVRVSWRLALAGVAAVVVAQWSREAAPPPVAPAATSVFANPTYVHVKYASEAGALGALGGAGTLGGDAERLFTSLSADVHDDRARWIRVQVGSRAAADALVKQLEASPVVEQAFVEPEVALASHFDDGDRALRAPDEVVDGAFADDSCPVTTPSFESYQGYLGPAPHGIDAPAAWRRGFRGAGEWFADVEGGWNNTHEDLPGARIEHVAGRPIKDRSWRAHGTAVLGEVVGRDNGKGVVGIAPDVERVFTASIGNLSVADAIDTAAKRLRPGDVLLIELQQSGPRGRYLPVEYWDDTFDAIRAATKRGVVIIEAAGNGAEDLDHSAYKKKLDRNKRDSGAIMVGAGGPPRTGFRDRERLDFSNYGSRVDVQGWGRKVATLDYGDLQACDDERMDRHYTGEFSGTSSASPIVAGAAVLLEGIARERGRVLTPIELRELLAKTGTPQAGNTKEHIGPRPDLARAITALER